MPPFGVHWAVHRHWDHHPQPVDESVFLALMISLVFDPGACVRNPRASVIDGTVTMDDLAAGSP